MKYFITTLILLFLLFQPTISQEDEDYDEVIEYAEEHHPSNEIGVFLGATSYTGVGSWTAFTIGLEYEHIFHFTPAVYLGAYGEMITGDHSEILVGIPIGIEYSGFKLYMAPSLVFEQKHDETTAQTAKIQYPQIQAEEENLKESTMKFFLRFGTGYKFHLNHFSIIPNIALDIISSKTFVVYGLTFGYGF